MTIAAVPTFELVAEWGAALPDLRAQDVSDIAVGPDDDVYLLYRDLRAIVVARPDGSLVRTWGADVLGKGAHGVTPAADGTCWVVDADAHCIRRFDASGRQVASFGSGPANPAFAVPVAGEHPDHVARAFPPFTKPTRLAVASWGDLYISDGYGNCRIHRFTSDGRLVHSWGEPGNAPGHFNTPHAVFIDRQERVLVCDRENDRIQMFDRDGGFLGQWTDLQRPQAVVQDRDGRYYVAEGVWLKGRVSRMHGAVNPSPSRVSVLEGDGRVVARIGGGRPCTPGNFMAAHGIAMDSRGDLYVAEVSRSIRPKYPEVKEPGCVAVQKFRRTG